MASELNTTGHKSRTSPQSGVPERSGAAAFFGKQSGRTAEQSSGPDRSQFRQALEVARNQADARRAEQEQADRRASTQEQDRRLEDRKPQRKTDESTRDAGRKEKRDSAARAESRSTKEDAQADARTSADENQVAEAPDERSPAADKHTNLVSAKGDAGSDLDNAAFAALHKSKLDLKQLTLVKGGAGKQSDHFKTAKTDSLDWASLVSKLSAGASADSGAEELGEEQLAGKKWRPVRAEEQGQTKSKSVTREQVQAALSDAGTKVAQDKKAASEGQPGKDTQRVSVELDGRKWSVSDTRTDSESRSGDQDAAEKDLHDSRADTRRTRKGKARTDKAGVETKSSEFKLGGEESARQESAPLRRAAVDQSAPSRDAKRLFNELVQKARMSLGPDGRSSASVRLNPEHLGRMTLNLQMQGNKLHARLLVDSPAAEKMLRQEMESLQRDLKLQGIQVESFSIRLRETTSTFDTNTQADQNANRGTGTGTDGQARERGEGDGSKKTADRGSERGTDLNTDDYELNVTVSNASDGRVDLSA